MSLFLKFRFAPFLPITTSKVFNRFNLASSRFMFVGVEGVDVFLLVWLYGVSFLPMVLPRLHSGLKGQ